MAAGLKPAKKIRRRSIKALPTLWTHPPKTPITSQLHRLVLNRENNREPHCRTQLNLKPLPRVSERTSPHASPAHSSRRTFASKWSPSLLQTDRPPDGNGSTSRPAVHPESALGESRHLSTQRKPARITTAFPNTLGRSSPHQHHSSGMRLLPSRQNRDHRYQSEVCFVSVA